jgi:hypothetical protein
VWPYWMLLLIPVWSVVSRGSLPERQARWVWRLVVLAVALLVGLRHEVGADWANYTRQFFQFGSTPLPDLLIEAKDPGYSFVGWVVAQLGGGVHALNFLCALPLALGTVKLSRRQPWPGMALLAAVPYLLIVVGMGYTRQSAAIGFAMLGLVALGGRRQREFLVCILIAATFHKSAILLLPIAALASTRDRVWSYVWASVMTVVGAWLFLLDSSDALVSNYIRSDYSDASQGAAIRVLMNAVPSLVALIFRARLFPDGAERKLWTSMAILALGCLPLLPVSATAVDRVALYFIPLQLVVTARLPRLANSKKVRTLVVIGAIAYYSAVQFVWLNFASHADAWLPYQFVPMAEL